MQLAAGCNQITAYGRNPRIQHRGRAMLITSTRCQAQEEDRNSFGRAIVSTSLAVSLSFLTINPQPVYAEDVYQQRKEMMEKLLQNMGKGSAQTGNQTGSEKETPQISQSEMKLESSAAPEVSSRAEEKVQAVAEGVKRGNAEREKEADRFAQSLKSNSSSYEADTKKNEEKKIGARNLTPDFDAGNYLKGIIDDSLKVSDEAKESSTATTPAPKFDFKDSGKTAPSFSPSKASPPAAIQKPSAPALPKPKDVAPVPVPKNEQKIDAKSGKRRGPLPMTVAQLLMLGVFGGIGYVTILREEELNRVLAFVGKAFADAFAQIGGTSKKAAKENSA